MVGRLRKTAESLFFRDHHRGRRVLHKVLFTLACLVLPVIWGVLVNWLFNLWRGRTVHNENDEPIFPDYQI